MSTSKGSTQRKRPQKHQNRTVFKNNLHDTSHQTKFLNSLNVAGVCKRCKDIIDWKIKYKKYKTLSAPTKCVGCQQKTVKYAYHVLCRSCAKERNVCAKCCKAEEVIPESHNDNNAVDITSMLKTLPERKRRTVLRYINKNNGSDQNIPSEMMSHIQEVIERMEKVDFDCEDDEFGFSTDEDSNSEVE